MLKQKLRQSQTFIDFLIACKPTANAYNVRVHMTQQQHRRVSMHVLQICLGTKPATESVRVSLKFYKKKFYFFTTIFSINSYGPSQPHQQTHIYTYHILRVDICFAIVKHFFDIARTYATKKQKTKNSNNRNNKYII